MANAQKDAVEKLREKVEKARAESMARVGLRMAEDLAVLAKQCETHKLGTNANGWENPYPKDDPRNLYLEYQFAYATDDSRFKIEIASRQSGKDFSSEGEAAEDCHKRPRTEWMIAAPSERQALDSLEQGKTWAQAFDLKINDYQEKREGTNPETLLKSAEIIFDNGSRMRAVPGRPDTVRGRSANILLTEFDFFENPAETWRAILPSITNPLRGGLKKVRLITTPNGIGGGAHAIWNKPDSGKMKWSRHLVTIYHAVLMGLPVDIAELQEAFGDPDGWAQEFECQFLDTATVLLPYEVIAACENPMAFAAAPADFWFSREASMPRFLGIDFGRSKDLTVCWTLEDAFGFGLTREVLEVSNTSTPDQLDILRPRIQRAQRVAFDYTGPGVGLGDFLVKEFGQWNPEKNLFGKIELCTFTNNFKCDIFPKLRMAFDNRKVGIPVSKVIREDLHSVNRIVTAASNVTYRAPHTPDGHADRCTALALAWRAKGYDALGCGAVVG